ncbi:hypothetical protein ACVW0I_008369 [Bradyrhizobium sp. LM6.11]
MVKKPRSPPSARARILGFLLGELGEIGTLVELGLHRLGLVLGLDQDVARANFLLAGDLLGGLVIDLLHCVRGDGGLALAGEQAVHQQAVAGECEALLELLAVGDLLVLGGLADDLHVDQEGQDVLVLGRRVHLGEARPEFLLGHGDVALLDFRAIDLRQYRIVGGPERARERQGQRQSEAASQGGRVAETLAGCYRERGGHGKSFC